MGAPSNSSVSFANDTCNDWIGRPIKPSTFGCVNRKGDVLVINGTVDYSAPWPIGYRKTFNNFPMVMTTGLNTDPLTAPSGWMLDLVAGTNPSRPVVTPPTLMQDLVELPSMLREAGRFLQNPAAYSSPRGLASVFLGVKFGWAPLIDDINHLLDLQSYVDKRTKELTKLYSGKGLRRRLRFSDTTLNENRDHTVATLFSGTVVLPIDVSVRKEVWGTITWRPTTLPPWHPDDVRNNMLARRLVLGMTSEGLAKGLWDVIPWTWLLGWFTNIGKYALAHSNTVPADHSDGCLMRQSITTYRPGTLRYSGNWVDKHLTYSGSQTFSQKNRTVASAVTPGVNMPFMDVSRLSVLGALFTQRFMR